MFEFIGKAIQAKNALQNAPFELPGLKLPGSQVQAARDQFAQYDQSKQSFLNSLLPQPVHNVNDMKYKMRAGMASNLGMPMDTFMGDQDFAQYGMQRPKPFDQGEADMMGILRQMYKR